MSINVTQAKMLRVINISNIKTMLSNWYQNGDTKIVVIRM